MPFEKDPNEIGALWLKQGSKGPYLTGTINGEAVVCFQNTRKTSDKQPEYRVLKSKPRDAMATPPEHTHNANAPVPSDDEIPF